jgi:hypothetical protein
MQYFSAGEISSFPLPKEILDEYMVKKQLSQEASTKKPLLDHSRSQWLLGTGFLTSVKISVGFFVILSWLLGQRASKKLL